MASKEVERLTSADSEEVFLAETKTLALLLADLQVREQQDIVNECISTTKGPTQSSVARCGAGVEADDAHIQAAEILGKKLRYTADRYRGVLEQEFDAQVQRSVWDVTYGTFRDACMGALRLTVNGVSDRWEQILLIYAGYLRISTELQQVGGDVSRQNEFAAYVARFLNDHDFGTWIQEQGGWQQLGEAIRPGTDASIFVPPEGTAV